MSIHSTDFTFRVPWLPAKDVKLTVAYAVAGLMKFCLLVVTSALFILVRGMTCSQPVFCQTSEGKIEKPSLNEASPAPGSFPSRRHARKEGMTSLDLLLDDPKDSGPKLAEISQEKVS